MDNTNRLLNQSEAANTAIGKGGFIRISNTSSHTGPFNAILAINGDVVLGAGNESYEHDNFQEDDVIPEGVSIVGHFKTVVRKSGGVLLAFKPKISS